MTKIKEGDKFTDNLFPGKVFTCRTPIYIQDTNMAYHPDMQCTLLSSVRNGLHHSSWRYVH